MGPCPYCPSYHTAHTSQKMGPYCSGLLYRLIRESLIFARFSAAGMGVGLYTGWLMCEYQSVNQPINRRFIWRINAKPLMHWYASRRRKKESGSAFQAIGPATEKARRPNCMRRWRRMTSWYIQWNDEYIQYYDNINLLIVTSLVVFCQSPVYLTLVLRTYYFGNVQFR